MGVPSLPADDLSPQTSFGATPETAYALTIEYDGSAFSGWQQQPGRRTVAAVVASAIAAVTGESPRLVAAGRTDAGAHAHGQVVGFRLARPWEPERLARALDARLPTDVAVVALRRVPARFHPRFDALRRAYRYVVAPRRHRLAVARQYAWAVAADLDLEAMRRAASRLCGRHDFAAFGRPVRPNGTTVRTVHRIDVVPLGAMSLVAQTGLARAALAALSAEDEYVVIEVEADAFLGGMMRGIAGTLVAVGAGRMSADEVAAILAAGAAGRSLVTVAPAFGLHQWRVTYPFELTVAAVSSPNQLEIRA